MSEARPEQIRSGGGPREGSPLSVVIVTHDSAEELRRSLPALAAELREGDEVIICDNASADATTSVVAERAPGARVIESGANLGFGAACNSGAEAAAAELLVFLNPDAEVQPGWRRAIELPLAEGRGWDAWQGLVTADGGRVVNTWGGVVHFTGIAWAGGAGSDLAEAPGAPREVAFASGACLAITRPAWEAIGGFSPEYFLYHEDADLGLRLWLGGYRVGIEPRARVDHGYEFEKGAGKWLYLERNRWATIIRTYPAALLVLLAPALLATELALLGVAAAGGWLGPKLRGGAQALRWTPRLLRERAAIRAAAASGPGPRLGAAGLAALLEPRLDSPFLGRIGRSAAVGALLGAYWRLVRLLLGVRRG